MAFLEPVIRWFNANKAVAVLSVLLFAFFISTIALAVRKNNLSSELTECLAHTDGTVAPQLEYRMSNKVSPIAYDLTLIPNLKEDSFDGKIKIKIHVLENTRHIVLHKGTDMVISKAQVERTGQDPISFALSYNTTFDYVILELNGVLQATATADKYHQIYLEFSSKNMGDSNLGFYSSEYTDGGKTHKMVSSKFQPTYARRAFPCFDEPGLKAKFTIRMVTPGGDYSALSNMEVDTTVDYPNGPVEGSKLVTFKESVEMSTYLAVFIVSELKAAHTATLTNTQILFTVYTAPDQTADGLYAFEVGKKLAEFYINYFGVDYPLKKLDMAAIPEYPSGATEHWGLITFRQTSFLYNKATSSARNKFRVAAVISHELVHQWFGNLVTMNWWNDIWLNEGFASYIEYKGLASAEPTWDLMDHFTVEDLHAVLLTDSLPSTRPIVKDADTPDEITALFDAISYNKGASIIRMLDDFVGNDNFQKVVSTYIKAFQYKTTVTSDFMKAFEDLKLDYNVQEVMATWTEQPGYPLLTVTKLNDTFIRVSQKRYFVNTETTGLQLKYTIPIRYRTNADAPGTTQFVWLKKDEEHVDINLGGVRTWYKLNEDQVGYYRVNYEEAMWTELIKVMNTWDAQGNPQFSTLNRAHLLNEAFALSDGEYLSYNITLDMLQYLTKETNLIPWTVSITQIKKILSLLFTDVIQGDLLDFFHKLATPVYNAVKFSACDNTDSQAAYFGYVFAEDDEGATTDDVENTELTDDVDGTSTTTEAVEICDAEENLNTELLREKLVDLLCLLGHEECQRLVELRFKSFVELNDDKIDPNVRQSVYYYGLRQANHTVWNLVFDRLKKTTDPQEATKLMYGLSATQYPFLAITYIERAWDELKTQDFFTILQYLSENQQGGADEIVWSWVRDNWPRLVERFTLNDRTMGRMVVNITKRFATKKKLDEMNAFFAAYPQAGAGAAAREEAKETIATNIRWVEKNRPIIAAWLKDHA